MFHLYEKINNNEVYFIAEMSANHGGNINVAKDIIKYAADAGADCIKIQTYTADSMTIDCDRSEFLIKGGLWDGYKLYDLYTDAATPYAWHRELKDECEKYGVDFLSTPFDNNATDFLDDLGVEAFKIASFELVDIPFIEYTASKHKPMIMSCGMASVEEIRDAVDACKRVDNNDIVLLKCCSEYPAPWDDMKLGNIPDMAKRFEVPIGLSDHSAGSMGAVVGVALGACIIEKHVKIDGVQSADSAFSMTMSEFKQMIKDVRAVELIKKGPNYSLTNGEKSSTVFRRSLFAVKDIKAGEEFTKENVRSIRPGNGLMPKFYNDLIGTKAQKDISLGEPIVSEHIEEAILEKQFARDMVYIYEEGKKYNYIANRFKQMLDKYGGVEAARKVIGTEKTIEGFEKLAKLNKLEISVEAYILKPEYKSLFKQEEIEICRNRLKKFGFL